MAESCIAEEARHPCLWSTEQPKLRPLSPRAPSHGAILPASPRWYGCPWRRHGGTFREAVT